MLHSFRPPNHMTMNLCGPPGEFSGPDAELIFFSPLSLALFSNQGVLIPRFNIMSLDLNPRMGSVTIPVQLSWGEYDLNSQPELATNARDCLGTPPADIRLHIFPDSGHNPCVDRPAEYLPLLMDFIEAYR
jgi:pimeloyl-ACP methyl ester carboxylesterase